MHPWSEMKWWNSGERQVVEEKIDDAVRAGHVCNPTKSRLYRALRATPERTVRVAILGQDPYPAHEMATGIAFSIPRTVPPKDFPHTLKIIFSEYCSDLHLPSPSHGDLSSWTKQGVLLWNSIPSCQSGHSLSHDWDEWRYLTGEIVSRLNERGGVVFVCLGAVASSFVNDVNIEKNRVIRTSHPSPRGIRASKSPFTGSRLFSTINARLRELEKDVIDWEISDDHPGSVPPAPAVRGNILQNITGASLGGLKPVGVSPNIYASFAF
jgi:uracil-DNA glycosylase